jgi:hypothetical protein
MGHSRQFWHARRMSVNRLISEMLGVPLIAPPTATSQRTQIVRYVAEFSDHLGVAKGSPVRLNATAPTWLSFRDNVSAASLTHHSLSLGMPALASFMCLLGADRRR